MDDLNRDYLGPLSTHACIRVSMEGIWTPVGRRRLQCPAHWRCRPRGGGINFRCFYWNQYALP